MKVKLKLKRRIIELTREDDLSQWNDRIVKLAQKLGMDTAYLSVREKPIDTAWELAVEIETRRLDTTSLFDANRT